MTSRPWYCRRAPAIGALLVVALAPAAAHAWAIGSQINETGCHEPITAQTLRTVRAQFSTAPAIAPSRDEAAMIRAVLFSPPADFTDDLAGMALLLGVRDNDLKGINPLSSLDLIQVHGNPETQDEHCIRSADNDDAQGDRDALDACRAFIVATATEALDGLDATGQVDPASHMPLALYIAFRGRITPELPRFYVKMGAAMHALEDGFPHTYRTPDGMTVTTVLNWIDLVGGSYDEARDGPGHRAELDRCWDASDPTIHRNRELSTRAATELLAVALDPGLDRAHKIAGFGEVATRYLGYQPGCTAANQWCSPAEATVTNSMACTAGPGAANPAGVLVVLGLVFLARSRARRSRRPRSGRLRRIARRLGALAWNAGLGRLAPTCARIARLAVARLAVARLAVARLAVIVALVVTALATPAHADPPPAPARRPATAPAPDPSAAPATQPAPDQPAVPVTEPEPENQPGKEPGRDIKTPTVQEVEKVREDKKLGSPWGVTATFGAAIDRPAAVASLGGRYRLTERWVVGLDAAWNPWVTTSPMAMHAGVATFYATLIRRFPMRYDRVNLRSSLHLGTSTLLFDVYGAPKYSTGLYGAISPLGLDYDLGKSVRIVLDPMEIALPVPLLGQLPLYYEQFRFVVGIQIGA
ncbi:MAG TPA: hypothetical protein VFK02_31380 [Kofleriaceae bacterium]|nr:hypothetical protein [Kofleriaceae bacterium]